MSIVMLVSGGLDSTLMTSLAVEEKVDVFPLFVDYGQRNAEREWEACAANMALLGISTPEVARLDGYGRLLPSGLTDRSRHVKRDAFLPGRNMLLLTVGASYAYRVGASAVAIGLLHEETALFPDQTNEFLRSAEQTLSSAIGRAIRVVAPLRGLSKREVVAITAARGIRNTYSCHAGGAEPCGQCIACEEYQF